MADDALSAATDNGAPKLGEVREIDQVECCQIWNPRQRLYAVLIGKMKSESGKRTDSSQKRKEQLSSRR